MENNEVIITPISIDEMPPARGHNAPRTAVEFNNVRSLPDKSGIKFKCRWKHTVDKRSKQTPTIRCSGVMLVQVNARRHKKTMTVRCHEGYIYVWRIT